MAIVQIRSMSACNTTMFRRIFLRFAAAIGHRLPNDLDGNDTGPSKDGPASTIGAGATGGTLDVSLLLMVIRSAIVGKFYHSQLPLQVAPFHVDTSVSGIE